MSRTLNVECTIDLKYAKHSLFVLKILALFRLCHADVRKDTRLSLLFQYCASDGSWAGSSNKVGRGGGSKTENLPN